MGEKGGHSRILLSFLCKARLMLLPHNVRAHNFLNEDKRLCHVPLLLRQTFELRKAEEDFGVTNLGEKRRGSVEGTRLLSGACGVERGTRNEMRNCWLLHLVILPRQCSIADLAATLSSVRRILIKAESKEPVLPYKGGERVAHGISHLWWRRERGLYEARMDVDLCQ
jgi:hypothetical protein